MFSCRNSVKWHQAQSTESVVESEKWKDSEGDMIVIDVGVEIIMTLREDCGDWKEFENEC